MNPFAYMATTYSLDLMVHLLSGENRYAMLERFHPELSKAFRAKIEKDYADRYAILTHMADADFSKPEPEENVTCGVSAENPGSGEPCDDGR